MPRHAHSDTWGSVTEVICIVVVHPQVAKVAEGMLTVILDSVGLEQFERVTHFHVRELAAACLAEFLK